jgi:L-amino acid N-acyltransferase YncA
VEFVRLGPADRQHLETFECSSGRKAYWTLEVERQIRETLPWFLDHPEEGAVIGLCDGGDLCGIAAWSPRHDDPGVWQTHVIAVRNGRKGKGHGERLKREVLERARAAGADAVIAIVHADNQPMLRINGQLGADIATDPKDFNYKICTIFL